MKKSKNYLLLSFCLFIISVNNGHSQINKGIKDYSAYPYAVMIGTNSLKAENVAIKDSIGDNKMIYTVAFNLKLKVTDELKAILGELQSSLANNKPVSLTLASLNHDLKELEVRVYAAANVENMELCELDGASKAEAWIRIKIRSSVLQIRPGSDRKMPSLENQKGASVLRCNFKLQLGQLPCERLTSTGFLNITIAGKPVDFTLEFPLIEAKEWHDWLMEASTGSQKKLHGSLVLLGPDFSTHLIEIELKDVQMTSYNVKTDPTILPKANISLRAGNISMVLPNK